MKPVAGLPDYSPASLRNLTLNAIRKLPFNLQEKVKNLSATHSIDDVIATALNIPLASLRDGSFFSIDRTDSLRFPICFYPIAINQNQVSDNGLGAVNAAIGQSLDNIRQIFYPISLSYYSGFDWRNVNGRSYVTEIKSQDCGHCWIYATTALLESAAMIGFKHSRPATDTTTVSSMDLSEQEVGNCIYIGSAQYNNVTGQWINVGNTCNGGWFTSVLGYAQQYGMPDFASIPETYNGDDAYLKKDTTVTSVEHCPYTVTFDNSVGTTTGDIFNDPNAGYVSGTTPAPPTHALFSHLRAHPSSWGQISAATGDISVNIATVVDALHKYGPLGFGFLVADGFGGTDIYNDPTNSCWNATMPYDATHNGNNKYINHAMLIVGYQFEYTTTHFLPIGIKPIPDLTKSYWIVKNSWGTGWGIDGYIHVAMDNGHNNYPRDNCGNKLYVTPPPSQNTCRMLDVLYYAVYDNTTDPCGFNSRGAFNDPSSTNIPTGFERATCYEHLCRLDSPESDSPFCSEYRCHFHDAAQSMCTVSSSVIDTTSSSTLFLDQLRNIGTSKQFPLNPNWWKIIAAKNAVCSLYHQLFTTLFNSCSQTRFPRPIPIGPFPPIHIPGPDPIEFSVDTQSILAIQHAAEISSLSAVSQQQVPTRLT
jgi:C1A family cysteine protease